MVTIEDVKEENLFQKQWFKRNNRGASQPKDAFDYNDLNSSFKDSNWNDGALNPIHDLLDYSEYTKLDSDSWEYNDKFIAEHVSANWDFNTEQFILNIAFDKDVYHFERYKHRGNIEEAKFNGEDITLNQYIELLNKLKIKHI